MVIDAGALGGENGPERDLRLFLAHVASLSREQVLGLGEATTALVAEGADRERTTKGYLFAWYEGPRLSDQESRAFGNYFQEVVAALAIAVSGTDPHMLVPARSQKGGLTGAIKELFLPYQERNELGEFAVRILETSLAPTDPRPIIVAAWNAGSAVWMAGRIPAGIEATLSAPWRRAVGDPPS
ncbi:MAG: hypothetical protein MUE82_11600 [Chloroflexi bacterium]|jgi:hypothetical protein|nr:hypothetical protein [Chloroflexota bacterium]